MFYFNKRFLEGVLMNNFHKFQNIKANFKNLHKTTIFVYVCNCANFLFWMINKFNISCYI